MRKFSLFIFVMIPFLAFSQKSNFGNWMMYFGNKKINKSFNWHSEVQYRNYNAVGDLEQLLLRTGFGYNLTENNNNILIGYGFIWSQNYVGNANEKEDVLEHRIYQQFVTKHAIDRVSVRHRYRFEQRFVNDDFKMRFRYLLGVQIPLNNKEMVDKTAYISLYNEIFLNPQTEFFDRNRTYGGVGFKLNKIFRFEIGYLNQFLANGNRDQLNIMTFINF